MCLQGSSIALQTSISLIQKETQRFFPWSKPRVWFQHYLRFIYLQRNGEPNYTFLIDRISM
uniref:Uncharacterized protein n=1 Tax=Arundo donax TaxID=35708 RepID=A0A0A9FZ90_ARUDO